MRILLVTPPMTQLNTPYPATAFLTGWLKKLGLDAVQADLALELALKIFSREGLIRISEKLEAAPAAARRPEVVRAFLAQKDAYALAVGPVVRFLQGRDPSLAYRITGGGFLPSGCRLDSVNQEALSWALGMQSVQDLGKHLASLFLDEIGDVVREGIDPRFGLARYAEKLAESTVSFDPIRGALDLAAAGKGTLIDEFLDEIVDEKVRELQPDVIGISVPFSGNVYGAFRVAQKVKQMVRTMNRRLPLILGGGYVNTELRELSEPAVFDYFDYVTLDDGEAPVAAILESLREAPSGAKGALVRTFVRREGRVVFENAGAAAQKPHVHAEAPTPDYRGLPLDSYLSFLEMLNPMHRLWSDGRWNKLMVAHGCYWRKCTFCDTSLDYIGRYEPGAAARTVDQMQELIAQTGQTGFHFVDEAAPPALLKGIAEEILRRGLVVTWWGNIRFEKAFTPELADLLARSGCVAVSGGLEAASDRLLGLMQKGVTVEQVARVTRALTSAGILVHAYLIYGFPSQTVQETVDALERVRQLFEAGCLHSAFWHRFSATVHSPVGRNPGKFGVRILTPVPETGTPVFARNDVSFTDLSGATDEEKEMLGRGLAKAVYNYMQGAGFDLELRAWFDAKVPRPKVKRTEIASYLGSRQPGRGAGRK